jgi:hypothetical protein
MKKLLLAGLLTTVFVATAVAAEKKDEKKSTYPLTTCLVSDEKLDSMGKPYVTKIDGREVQLCCKACEKDLKKDSAKYLKKLDAASKKDNAAKK